MAKNKIFYVTTDISKTVKKITGWSKKSNKKFATFLKRGIDDNSHSMVELSDMSKRYWKNNVYKVFNKRRHNGLKNSGQLGRSLYLKHDKNGEIHYKMHRLTHNGDKSSGGKDWDYGRYLRNDRGNTNSPQTGTFVKNGEVKNRGTYSRYYDYKVNTTKGQRALSPEYWEKWSTRYERNFRKHIKSVVPLVLDEYFEKHGFMRGKK